MFRKIYNYATIEALLEPDGPILIVQGGAPPDPLAPDLAFVRSWRNGVPTVYLPGSSLKGVLRAQAERLLVTLVGAEAAEDPFEFDAPARKLAHEARMDGNTSEVYRVSCEADKLFGSTEIAGRFQLADAFPEDVGEGEATEPHAEIRYGVAIDRKKQSVKHGPFEQEVVTSGCFLFKATLENFPLWMLGLVLQVIEDLHKGRVRVGHGKSRGYGAMRVLKPQVEILWPGRRPTELEGAGAREAESAVRLAYGLPDQDFVPLPLGGEECQAQLFEGHLFKGWEAVRGVQNAIYEGPWRRFLARAS